MGYQALLFCADEKTARLVTQVLTELDFSVEPANEPFAAVKRLTTQHFDAVVVDCENEQNGALLFKTARNSGPNRTSLAVAVVEGQPGIAKAFRIGANLVLTKPINVEQSKGTLRVARGLLKKSEGSKPAVPASPAPPAVAAPVASPSSLTPRPLTPAPPVSKPRALTTPPAPVVRAEATSALELDQDPIPQPEPADAALLESMPEPAAPPAPRAATPGLTPKPAPWGPPKPTPSAGAAAGTAPARTVQQARFDAVDPGAAIAPAPKRSTEAPAPRVTPRSVEAPVLTAASAPESGGSKKGLIIGLIVVALAAAGYFGWTKFRPAPGQTAPAPATPVQTAPKPSATASAPSAPASAPAETAKPEASSVAAPTSPASRAEEESPEVVQRAVAPAPKPEKPAQSITVKSSVSKSAPAEAPQALPVIGITSGGNDKAISGLMDSAGSVRTPVLRTVKISQGVSQGLLLKKVAPDYPMQARQLRVEGAVQLEATVSKEGNVTGVKVLGGHPILARAATDAIKRWKYKPYLLNGQPVEIETQITINFKLP